MSGIRKLVTVAFVAWAAWASTVSAQDVHLSPDERLDALDAALIDGAERSLDFAAYVQRLQRRSYHNGDEAVLKAKPDISSTAC